MIRKTFGLLVIFPLAIVLVAFAIANRQPVTVAFDPFNSNEPAFSLTLPLFVVIILAAMLGVLAGGIVTWFGQWRKYCATARQRIQVRLARSHRD